jgi:glycogen debranching enzyme
VKREPENTATVLVPGVVSLAASSRRTLKHGDSFAMFDEFGDVLDAELSPTGLFHHDTRYLSRLRFTIEGHRPLALSSTVQPDNVMLDVDLTNPDLFDREGNLVLGKDTFHVARSKFLWQACCYELFTITSYSESRRRLRCALEFDADFADLFEVRGYRRSGRGRISARVVSRNEVEYAYDSLDGLPRRMRICFAPSPTQLAEGRAAFELDLAAPQPRRQADSSDAEPGTYQHRVHVS